MNMLGEANVGRSNRCLPRHVDRWDRRSDALVADFGKEWKKEKSYRNLKKKKKKIAMIQQLMRSLFPPWRSLCERLCLEAEKVS